MAFVGDLSCAVVAMRFVVNGPRVWFKSPLGCEMRAKQQRNLLETSIICVKSSVRYYIHTYILLNLNISFKKRGKKKKNTPNLALLKKKRNQNLLSLVATPLSFFSSHTQHTHTCVYTYIHKFRVRVTRSEKKQTLRKREKEEKKCIQA